MIYTVFRKYIFRAFCDFFGVSNFFFAASGVITDEPGQYRSNMDCKYLFFSKYVVSLWFTSFNTRAGGDVVPVNRCSTESCAEKTQLWNCSGAGTQLNFFYISNPYSQPFLQVVFTSDASGSNDGWSANWVVRKTGA